MIILKKWTRKKSWWVIKKSSPWTATTRATRPLPTWSWGQPGPRCRWEKQENMDSPLDYLFHPECHQDHPYLDLLSWWAAPWRYRKSLEHSPLLLSFPRRTATRCCKRTRSWASPTLGRGWVSSGIPWLKRRRRIIGKLSFKFVNLHFFLAWKEAKFHF